MKTIVNQEYSALRPLLDEIAAGRYEAEHVYCNSRNTVERLSVADGGRIVVKRFKCPNAVNRRVYGRWRKSKARRAYEYAFRLLERGIDTPRPIAYMEQKRRGLFRSSWFVSAFAEGTPFSDAYAELRRQAAQGNPEARLEMEKLRAALTGYVLMFEQKRVCPGDFNHDNILVRQTEEGYRFTLVDINRMHFDRQPTLRSTMKMYSQFCRSYGDALEFIPLYAQSKGLDFDECMYEFAQRRNHLLQRKRKKQFFHKLCDRK